MNQGRAEQLAQQGPRVQPEQLEQLEQPDPRGKILEMQSIDFKNAIKYSNSFDLSVCVCL